MDGVVLAAGVGRRLRPLTERWPKAVLPIDRSPVIALVLRELAAAGVVRVTVVVGHLADQIEALVGDGAAFGLEVRYARQPRPLGSGDALREALAAGAATPLVATAADTAYRPGDLAAALAAFEATRAAGALGVRVVPRHEVPERSLVRVQGGRVLEVIEKPGARPAGSSLAAAPLWLLRATIVPYVESVGGPPHELAAAFQRAIDAGEEVAALEIGPTRDITRPADVALHNFPYLWR